MASSSSCLGASSSAASSYIDTLSVAASEALARTVAIRDSGRGGGQHIVGKG